MLDAQKFDFEYLWMHNKVRLQSAANADKGYNQ